MVSKRVVLVSIWFLLVSFVLLINLGVIVMRDIQIMKCDANTYYFRDEKGYLFPVIAWRFRDDEVQCYVMLDGSVVLVDAINTGSEGIVGPGMLSHKEL